MKNKYYSKKTNENGETTIILHCFPTLYRYQSVNPHSVSALLNDELWGSLPTIFNDPYDSIFCYNSSKIKSALLAKLKKRDIEKFKTLFRSNNKKELVNKLMLNILGNFNNCLRQTYCIACFSERFDSEIMWGHYADSAKGFVVAYDGKELDDIAFSKSKEFYEFIKSSNFFNIDFSNIPEFNLKTVAPVVYSSGKCNVTSEIIDTIDNILNYCDNLCGGMNRFEADRILYDKTMGNGCNSQANQEKIYSALYNKSKEWKYEKEWRVWSYNTNILTGQINNPHVLIGNNAKAKAIYLGEKISEYNRIAMTEIAKRKNIPIYIMKTIMLKNNCKLVRELIK